MQKGENLGCIKWTNSQTHLWLCSRSWAAWGRGGRRKVPQLRLLVRFVLLMLVRCNGANDELIRLGAVDGFLTILGIIVGAWRCRRAAVVGVQRRLLGAHLSLVFGRLDSSGVEAELLLSSAGLAWLLLASASTAWAQTRPVWEDRCRCHFRVCICEKQHLFWCTKRLQLLKLNYFMPLNGSTVKKSYLCPLNVLWCSI